MRKRNRKKNGLSIQRRVLFVLVILTIVVLGLGVTKTVKASKINSSLLVGIKYLEDEKYDDALKAFSKVISIDKDNEKANELLSLVERFKEVNKLFNEYEYDSVLNLLNKIKQNTYSSYVTNKISDVEKQAEEKIKKFKEIDGLEPAINNLIAEEKYQEAIDLIKKYQKEGLNKKYSEKLQSLINKVNEVSGSNENLQQPIEEPKKEEESIKEESNYYPEYNYPNYYPEDDYPTYQPPASGGTNSGGGITPGEGSNPNPGGGTNPDGGANSGGGTTPDEGDNPNPGGSVPEGGNDSNSGEVESQGDVGATT